MPFMPKPALRDITCLANHCVDTLTKEQFLGTCGASRSYYSLDVGGFHFVILDACFRHDGQPYGNKNSNWTDATSPSPNSNG